MFNINLNHITAENLAKVTPLPAMFEQAPWKYLDISQFDWDSEHTNLQQRAITTFDKLYRNEGQDISLFDVLALLVIEQDRWEDKQVAHKVCDSLWKSMINSTNQTVCLNTCLLFTVHYVQSPEFYTEISINKQAMFDSLKITLHKASREYTWRDDALKKISQTLVANQPKQFAVLAFEHQQAVESLQKYAKLSISKTFIAQSQDEWMNRYFALGTKQPKQLSAYEDAIIIHLKRKNGVAYAVEQAKMIFDHPYFGDKNDLTKLESKVKPFETIFEWLKEWSSNDDFMALLDSDYRSVLRCWLGSGNYYQLENIINYIAEYSGDKDNERRTKRRFNFWTDYQNYFIDNYLLIPQKDWTQYTKYFMQKNIIKIDGGNYPLALIKVAVSGKIYYIIQTFIADNRNSDLIMTPCVDEIDQQIRNTVFNYAVIRNIQPVLIHDHSSWWQYDLVKSLKIFGMNNSKNKTYNTELDERERALRIWYNQHKKNEHYGRFLDSCALSYQRYFG